MRHMVLGKNSEFENKGMRYHIQTESWAPEENVIVSQVFLQGRVILREKFPIKTNSMDLIKQEIELFHEGVINKVKTLLI